MTSTFSALDYAIFIGYAVLILGVGLWVSRDKKGHQKNAEDYFLASKSLPWWAVGASLIAANISAEQFIGMSGSGFKIGLAIASYEWMAALTLILVGKYFLPIFIEKGLYTIPEFVEKRYSTELKTILAVFWISLYIFVNLASVLYLGSLALETIMGIPMVYGVLGLAAFAAAYSLYGGLSAVSWTDVIQVVFLVLGGLVTTYLALDAVSGGSGMWVGFQTIYEAAPDKFAMILDKGHPEYMNLPGIGVLVGGMWVANVYYWGFNQYIIQRTLAAKSLKESQRGILFAAGLKLILPLIVVIPGIAAYVMTQDAGVMASLGEAAANKPPTGANPDYAYPWLLQFLPTGLKGLAFAALAAAIVSSLGVHAEFDVHDFHDGHLQAIHQPRRGRPSDRAHGTDCGGRGLGHRVCDGTASRGHRSGIPIYSGIHRSSEPGYPRGFLAGVVLEENHQPWRHCRRTCLDSHRNVFQGGAQRLVRQRDVLGFAIPRSDGVHHVADHGGHRGVSWSEGQGADDAKGIAISKRTFKTGPVFNVGAFAVMVLLVAFTGCSGADPRYSALDGLRPTGSIW